MYVFVLLLVLGACPPLGLFLLSIVLTYWVLIVLPYWVLNKLTFGLLDKITGND